MGAEDERKLILKMLKENKINEEEALRLLDALKAERVDKDFKNDLNTLLNKLTLSAIDLGKKGQSFISGLDLDSINFESNDKNSSIIKEFNKNTIDIENPSISINVNSGSIDLSTWENDSIEVKGEVFYNKNQVKKDYDFFYLLEEDNNFTLTNNYENATIDSYKINYTIKVPSKNFDNFQLTTINSKIALSNILANKLTINSSNGPIEINGFQGKSINIQASNGKIDLSNIISKDTDIDNINGKITIDQINGENIKTYTSHGPISISNLGDEAQYIKAKTYIGNISLDLAFYEKPIKANLKDYMYDIDLRDGFNNSLFTNFVKSNYEIIAYSDNYDESQGHLYLEMETSNGKINIS